MLENTGTNAYSDSPKPPHSEFMSASSYVLIDDRLSAFGNGNELHHQTTLFIPSSFNMSSLTNATISTMARPSADKHPLYYLGIYSAITIGMAALGLIQTAISYVGAYRASKILHEKMLKSVIRSTTRWFDTTPSGSKLLFFLFSLAL